MNNLATGLAVLALFCVPGTAQADFVSSVGILGSIHYESSGEGPILFFDGDDLPDGLNDGGPYWGVLAGDYQLVVDLPNDDVTRDWWFEWDGFVEGTIGGEGVVPVSEVFNGMEEFTGTQAEVLAALSPLPEIVSFLGTIPLMGSGSDGFYEIYPDCCTPPGEHSGRFFAAATDDFLPLDDTNLDFGAIATLTAHEVPEPSTLLLLGTGLAMVGLRRRQQ